jgi:hypothetical protein
MKSYSSLFHSRRHAELDTKLLVTGRELTYFDHVLEQLCACVLDIHAATYLRLHLSLSHVTTNS